ncbi:Sip1-related alpha-galactosidase [Fulvivirgaceae bacterium BMA12]|uniref:Sip1-related alpha-galactosidase n=1 Tax=Agaribacillus aureus TaxID=3051825 RepID=A0ABT8L7Z0_9BACT|nr:Sip1-related alpha-galactosidase [Fulvivirgaceae bacterium BMA12]
MNLTFSIRKCSTLLLIIFGLGGCAEEQNTQDGIQNRIDIAASQGNNLMVLDSPDPLGTISQRQIMLPEFERYVHVAADSNHFRWIGASNRMFPWIGKDSLRSAFQPKNPTPPRIPHPNRRALTMVFQLRNGNYLTLLPLAGEASVSWLEVTEDGELILDYGSLGTNPIPENVQVPLLSWYESENVYESIAKAWEMALTSGKVNAAASLREKKKYPEPLNYLGWCTWEQYRKNIDEETLVAAIDNIENSGIPVRWVLIDDGHQDDESGLLKSLTPNREKFPNGWNPIVSRKQDDGIKWMGIWHGFLSHWDGVHVNHAMEDLAPFLVPNPDRKNGLLPKDDMASSNAFYAYLVTTIKTQGFDFMKTDNVSRSTLEYTGFSNASEAQRQNVLALEQACIDNGIGLMNCSAQNTIGLMNATNSATMRTSPDYQKHNLATSKSQILQSVFNVTWLGQTLWPDHDMFHSSDKEVGEAMSVTKAMSGGPIYLSDDPADFNDEVIMTLCYDDGLLIRPEAPAVPLPESIFNDALYESEKVYKTISPLKNKACAIAAYNLSVTAKHPLTGTIDKDDYTYAPAMMQPFEGFWEEPVEGLVIYDWKRQTGQKLDEAGMNFQIDGFGHQLFLLCPINNQWAVIGRPDKYLSPSTVDIVDIGNESITLKFAEMGSVILYSGKGTLSSTQMDFTHLGNNFYKGTLTNRLKGAGVIEIKRTGV